MDVITIFALKLAACLKILIGAEWFLVSDVMRFYSLYQFLAKLIFFRQSVIFEKSWHHIFLQIKPIIWCLLGNLKTSLFI